MSSLPDNIHFPRIRGKQTTSLPQEFPQNEEIINLLEKARTIAIEDVSAVGIDVPQDFDFKCQIKRESEVDVDEDEDLTDLNDLFDDDESEVDPQEIQNELDSKIESEVDTELRRNLHMLSSMPGELIAKTYDRFDITLNENSMYTVVCDNMGNEKVVRKSLICWLLTKDKHSLSSDRLRRVQQSELIHAGKFVTFFNVKMKKNS